MNSENRLADSPPLKPIHCCLPIFHSSPLTTSSHIKKCVVTATHTASSHFCVLLLNFSKTSFTPTFFHSLSSRLHPPIYFKNQQKRCTDSEIFYITRSCLDENTKDTNQIRIKKKSDSVKKVISLCPLLSLKEKKRLFHHQPIINIHHAPHTWKSPTYGEGVLGSGINKH